LTLPCNRALHPSALLRAKLPIAERLEAEAGLSSTSASPSRRRRWIRGALLISKASALVGGPPTDISVPARDNSAAIGTSFLGRTPPSFSSSEPGPADLTVCLRGLGAVRQAVRRWAWRRRAGV